MQILYNAIVMIIEVIGIGTIIAIFKEFRKTAKEQRKDLETLREGQRCQLRSDMLRTYYRNKDTKKIRQYELENFIKHYNAYKVLGGNSFIDKIYEEVMEWEVIT